MDQMFTSILYSLDGGGLSEFLWQGEDQESANKILEISKKIADYGAFALVIEAVPSDLADKITESINIPTIGIGASRNCDGQILVTDDLIGLNEEFKPKFVKNYDNFAQRLHNAVKCYQSDVINKKFPEDQNLTNYKANKVAK